MRIITTSIATLLLTASAYGSQVRQAPAAPHVPPPAPIAVMQAYLRDDQELGGSQYGLQPMGVLPDVKRQSWSAPYARRAHGTRRMGHMSYERSSSLPKPDQS